MGSGYEIARAIEQLIHNGHPPHVAWTYTPRQMKAWIDLGYRRQCSDNAQLLGLLATGGQGTGKSITATIKKLRSEGA